jgi:hypothetical protein
MRSSIAAALVAALLLSSAAGAPPAQARYKNFSCVWKSGPEYRFTIVGKHRKSTTYSLEGFGTTCSFAKHWVARLAKEPYRGNNKLVRHGPPGWRCRSGNIAALKPESVFKGVCQNKKDDRRVFDWQSFGESQPVDPPAPNPPSEPDPPA